MRWLLVPLACLLAFAAQAERRKSTPEERQRREVEEMRRRLNKSAARSPATPECQFVHARAAALVDRAAVQPPGSYIYERLEDTIDSLLDAADQIVKAAGRPGDDDDDPQKEQQRTSRDLERTYFRVLQGDYFAKQSREADAGQYVQFAKRLYQSARSAYDTRQYWRARRLAEAARELAGALESLAQAAVRIPEPPTLK